MLSETILREAGRLLPARSGRRRVVVGERQGLAFAHPAFLRTTAIETPLTFVCQQLLLKCPPPFDGCAIINAIGGCAVGAFSNVPFIGGSWPGW